MIKKPNGWENAQAFTGEYERMTAGGHIVKIIGVRAELSRNGADMVTVGFDIAEGKELDGFYERDLKRRRESNANAKHMGTIRYMLLDREGKPNSFFKGFIKAVEDSNPGYVWNWDERTLAGKKVGMVFREEEYLGNDQMPHMSVRAYQARSVEAIQKGVEVPKPKLLDGGTSTAYAAAAGFTPTTIENDELPF